MGREQKRNPAAQRKRELLQPAPDPPMEAWAESTVWFESSPRPIREKPDLAVLMIRIGLASNALLSQLQAGSDSGKHESPAARKRGIMSSLIVSAALTTESIKLAMSEMKTLRQLALQGGAKPAILERVSKLCAGKHPASKTLDVARNQLGFHWDRELVGASVREYGRNKKLVWVEWDESEQPLHRLAFEVLNHALIPAAANEFDQVKAKAAVSEALSAVDDAMQIILEFFSVSAYGYMMQSGIKRRRRQISAPSPGHSS